MASSITSSSTKTDLLAEIDRLNAALAATPAAEVSETYGNRLVQILWISDRYEIGKTQGGGLKVSFTGQVSAKNQDAIRVYGAYKNLIAYGEQADAAKAILEGEDRLVEIQAFEKPWSNNAKRSDWVILSISPVERTQPAAAPLGEAVTAEEAYDPGSEEPTLDTIPY